MDITLIIMIAGWLFALIWVPSVIAAKRKHHPRALFILFFAEMWERFSYYGMRALLTLYMVNVLFKAMGQAEADTRALSIYGAYTAMVYLTPVIGGLIADKVFGFRKAIIFGGVLMMLGHFALALEGMLFEGNLNLFFLSLALIIIGNGYFKPNISSFLGQFYESNDPRKDGAFTLFYMGVNIGAFLATLTCGYVGEKISWHYGFGLAGIGMALGLIVFWLNRNVFGEKGKQPNPEDANRPVFIGLSKNRIIFLGTLLFIPLCAVFLNLNEIVSALLLFASFGIIGYLVYTSVTDPDKVAGQRLLVIVVLFFFHAVFWALFEQAGGSLTLFTERNVDRMLFGTELPASIFQSFNPFYIMVLAPIFSWMWVKLNQKGYEPSTPMKFFLGLLQLGLGFGVIVLGAKFFATEGYVPLIFLAVMYLLHTTGELSLSPIGLSMITKLSPDRIVGFVMGAWFLSIALANNMAGLIGTLTASEDLPENASAMDTLVIYSQTYLTWGVYVVLGASALLLLLVPQLRKWMHGIH